MTLLFRLVYLNKGALSTKRLLVCRCSYFLLFFVYGVGGSSFLARCSSTAVLDDGPMIKMDCSWTVYRFIFCYFFLIINLLRSDVYVSRDNAWTRDVNNIYGLFFDFSAIIFYSGSASTCSAALFNMIVWSTVKDLVASGVV